MSSTYSLSLMATTELEYHKGVWKCGTTDCIFTSIYEFAVVIFDIFKVCWILTKNKFDFNAAKPSVHPEKNYPWNDKFVDEIKRALAANTRIINDTKYKKAFDSIAFTMFPTQYLNKFEYPRTKEDTHPAKTNYKKICAIFGTIFLMMIDAQILMYPVAMRAWAAVLQSFVDKDWYIG
nr:AIF_HP1_G0030850.mRNA.1.CDS.1 [Saccharomyces cerevisiae]